MFSNLTSSNSSGTSIANPFPIENASRNVDFTISADSGIDLSLIPGNRRAVLAVPEGLRGHVTANGTGTFSTNILLPENDLDPLFSIVNGATTTLINSINALINSNPLLNINLDDVYAQLNQLQSLSSLTAADVALQLQAQGDQYIYADLDGVLETIIRQDLIEILTDLDNAVQALTITGTGATLLNQTLNLTIKPVFNATFETAEALVNVGSTLLGDLVDASVLGQTTIILPTTITDPVYQDLVNQGIDMSNPYEAGFLATIVKSNVLSINIASGNDGYTPIYYRAATVTAPYDVAVTGSSSTGYEVTGYADPNTTVRIYKDDVLIAEGQTDGTGRFTIPVSADDVDALDEIELIAYDQNNIPSLPTPAIIPDDDETDADADSDADADADRDRAVALLADNLGTPPRNSGGSGYISSGGGIGSGYTSSAKQYPATGEEQSGALTALGALATFVTGLGIWNLEKIRKKTN